MGLMVWIKFNWRDKMNNFKAKEGNQGWKDHLGQWEISDKLGHKVS